MPVGVIDGAHLLAMHWTSETSGTFPEAGPTRQDAGPSTVQRVAVWVVALVGGLVAATASEASPTAWPLADAVERALLVALCALAGSRARRWTLLWAGAVALVCGGTTARVLGLCIVATTGALFLLHRRDRVVGAALGAAAGLAALDLQWPTGSGLTALVAAIAIAPLLLSGFRRAGSRPRRWIALGGVAVGVLVVLGVAVAAVFGLQQRSAVQSAVDRTRAAVDAVGGEDPAAARARFTEASDAFGAIADAGDAWWLAPARALPLVGPNLDLVRVAASTGADLNDAAAGLSSSVDQDALRRPDGGIDLTVLAGMDGPARKASTALRRAEADLRGARSPWLVAPVEDRLSEFRGQLASARRSAEVAELAVQRAPALLGADRPRRYLLLLGNPAEARDLGGHLGNWAEVMADGGKLRLVDVGTPYDLLSPSTTPPPFMTPGAYPQSLVEMRPQYFPQNWSGSVDMPTVTRLAAELYPQARPGHDLDGVIYADPAAFAGLLSITGPVPVPGSDVTLSADNAVSFLTVGQFAVIPDNGNGSRALDEVIRSVVAGFTNAKLPSPRRLADVFGPVVDQGRLQFVSTHPEDTQLLKEVGLFGDATRPGDGDLLAVVNRNANPSKIDAYLRRDVSYDVSWDPATGRTRSRVTIRLTNDVPAVGTLPPVVVQTPDGVPVGTNRTLLSVLSPLDAVSATVDGDRAGIGTQQEDATVRRHTVLVDVAPGATRTVTLDLEGAVGVGDYVLRWIGQPLVDPGRVHLSVRSSGAPLPLGAAVERDFRGDGDRTVSVPGPGA
jgi:hypothetical protein